jgi:hypothetical protein
MANARILQIFQDDKRVLDILKNPAGPTHAGRKPSQRYA